MTDTVGDLPVVVFATDEGVHVYENPDYEFEPAGVDATEGQAGSARADGAAWEPAPGESDDGRTLERLPARQMFAFAWQDAYGSEAFWAA